LTRVLLYGKNDDTLSLANPHCTTLADDLKWGKYYVGIECNLEPIITNLPTLMGSCIVDIVK
jgi:hypothetical protein